MKTFKYYAEVNWIGELDIDHLGQCCIEAVNENGESSYLLVETRYGQTTVFSFGPIVDTTYVPEKCNYNISRFEYAEGEISKKISDFLKGGKMRGEKIVQAREITRDEFLSRYINPILFIKKDSNPELDLDSDYTEDDYEGTDD